MIVMAKNCRHGDLGRVCQNWSHCGGPGNEGTAESRRSGIPPSTYFIEEPVAVSIIWADAVAEGGLPHINCH
jgi:hypothetical protein